MNTNHIILGDCLDDLRKIPSDSVDLVFTSPPYEGARTYGIGFNLAGQDWVDWALPRYIECVRVCRGLVAWVVEGRTKNFQYTATPALFMADLHRSGIKLRKPPIFHRVGVPGSGGPDWLRNDWEWIVCATKGKLPWSDNTAMGHPPKWAPGGEMSNRVSDGTRRNQWGAKTNGSAARNADGEMEGGRRPSHVVTTKAEIEAGVDPTIGRDKWGGTGNATSGEGRMANGEHKTRSQKQREDGEDGNESYSPPVKANPGNVIKCNVGGGVMGDRLCHENEAPFPEDLVEFFIRSFCKPGGIVLDPFCGSGTTLAMAERWGRKWIGMECRSSQVELSTRRLANVRAEKEQP